MNHIFNVLGATNIGLFTYAYYKNSRSLTAGWKEQRFFCTKDHIELVSMLALTTLSNSQFLFGTRFVSYFGKIKYLGCISMVGLYFLSKKVEKGETNEKKIIDSSTLGARVAACSDQTLRTQLQKEYLQDGSSLSQCIDQTLTQSKRSIYKKIFDSSVDFAFMHIPDALFLISTAQAVAAAYFGFNRVGNLIHFAFCALSILEEGFFWMEPKQHLGPLFKICEGSIVRAYSDILHRLLSITTPLNSFLFRGILGKLDTIVYLTLLLAGQFPKQALPIITALISRLPELPGDLKTAVVNYINEPQRFSDQLFPSPIIFETYVPTNKIFECFKIEDPNPNTTAQDMLNCAYSQLKDQPSNDPELENVLDPQKGIFYAYMNAAPDQQSKAKKECEIKVILTALLGKEWDEVASQIKKYSEELGKCDDAQADAINNLVLELYSNEQSRNRDDVEADAVNAPIPKLDEATALRLTRQCSLVLQSCRDILVLQQYQNIPQSNLKRYPTLMLFSQNKFKASYAEVKRISEIATSNWWRQLARCSLYKALMLGIKFSTPSFQHHQQNVHSVSKINYLLGGPLGLSSYPNARNEIKTSATYGIIPLPFLDFLSDLITPIAQNYFLTSWKEEPFNLIAEALLNDGDTRISYEDMKNYLIAQIPENKRDYWLEQELRFEFSKPVLQNNKLTSGDPDKYAKEKKKFIDKYLPKMLHEMGFLRER